MAAPIYPWLQPVNYLSQPRSDQFLDQSSLWLQGTWVRQTASRDGAAIPEFVVTRALGPRKRVESIRIEKSGGAAAHVRTIAFRYSTGGLLASYVDEAVGLKTTATYRYNSAGQLVEEISEKFGAGADHSKVVATHKRRNGRVRIQAKTNGLLRDEMVYDDKGILFEQFGYEGDPPLVWLHEKTDYNSRNQPVVRRLTQTGAPSPGQPRIVLGETTVTFVYSSNNLKVSSETAMQLIEGIGTKLMREVTDEYDTRFKPSLLEHSIDRQFGLNQAGAFQELVRIEKTISYDSQGEETQFVEAGTNFETGQSRSNVTKVVRDQGGKRVRRLTDLGADGTVDEEELLRMDDKGRVLESRRGKPDGGPFTSRRVVTYTTAGEIKRLEIYRDNNTIAAVVHEYMFQ
jgi:hypothetical protein